LQDLCLAGSKVVLREIFLKAILAFQLDENYSIYAFNLINYLSFWMTK